MSLLGYLSDNTSMGYPFENTSLVSPPDNTTLPQSPLHIHPNCDHVKSITVPITLTFIIIGLIGNPLVIILYRHMPIRVASTRVMFVVLAICDIISLCHLPLHQVLMFYGGLDMRTNYPFGFVNTVSASSSNFLVAAISVERYVRVFGSLPIGRNGYKRTAIIFCLVVIVIFSILFIGIAIPRGTIKTDAMKFYMKNVVFWMVFTANSITPTIGVVFANAIFIRQICAHKTEQQTLAGNTSSTASKQINSVSISLILISSIALFCHLPIAGITLAEKSLGPLCTLQEHMLAIFVAINHSMNFYIYFMGSIIKKTLAKCRGSEVKSQQSFVSTTSTVATTRV